MARCSICQAEMVPEKIFKHRWEKHPNESRALLGRRKKAEKNGGGDPGKSQGKDPEKTVKPAATIAEAQTLAIAPRRFEMSSILLWQARDAAIREWGWPADISPEDFLDTFLFEAFKQRGIVLGAYQVIENNGSKPKVLTH